MKQITDFPRVHLGILPTPLQELENVSREFGKNIYLKRDDMTGVALGGSIMFLLWRRVVKRFFWKFASRSPKLEKAQQWVNRFDTSSLFMLTLLPFTPSSFMHLAFGISDFDEKRYLITMLLGKGVMVALIALFGQSLVSSLKNPVYLVLAILLWAGMYWVSKKFCKKHNLE